MTALKPNAELAYMVLDHIDAHPELWEQGNYLRKTECGTVGCFAGWTCVLSGEGLVPGSGDGLYLASGERTSVRAEQLLGVSRYVDEHGDDGRDLFAWDNTREDLGRLVAEIFGPRPPVNEIDDSLSEPGYPVYAPCQPIGCDAGHHLSGCVYAETDDDVPPNAGSAS